MAKFALCGDKPLFSPQASQVGTGSLPFQLADRTAGGMCDPEAPLCPLQMLSFPPLEKHSTSNLMHSTHQEVFLGLSKRPNCQHPSQVQDRSHRPCPLDMSSQHSSPGRPHSRQESPRRGSLTWRGCWGCLAGKCQGTELPGLSKDSPTRPQCCDRSPVVPLSPDLLPVGSVFITSMLSSNIDNFYQVTRETGLESEPKVNSLAGSVSPLPTHTKGPRPPLPFLELAWLLGGVTFFLCRPLCVESCPHSWYLQSQ